MSRGHKTGRKSSTGQASQPVPSGMSSGNSRAKYEGHHAEYDDLGFLSNFVRAESMDLVNDPRYFTSNVIDKRLGAFGKLSVVSSLMLGTSFGQMFALKKDMNFEEFEFGVVPMGWMQFLAFTIQMNVAFMCLMAIYVIVHQVFYTYRLMTAGPHGFEQASMFYLSKQMCTWRHLAIRCIFNGLWLYMVASGLLIFVKFFKDAKSANGGPKKVVLLNAPPTSPSAPAHEETLSLEGHTILGGCLLLVFLCFACLLLKVRSEHLSSFKKHYSLAHELTHGLMHSHYEMSHRAGISVDT